MNPARRAFTLAELVAVVAVLAVVSVVAVPAAWWMAATRAGGAARVLVQDLTYAREHAMQSGTPSWVVFSTPAQTYSILAEDAANPGRDDAQPIEDPATGWAYTQAYGQGTFVGVSLVGASFEGAPEVGFDWLGRPLRAGGATLGSRGTVTLNDGFGCVVEPGTGLAWMTTP